MKILTIDTSSKNAIVAITEDEEKIIELNNEEEKTHSQKLMPMIDEAFHKLNLSLDDINLLACGLGPGSFTGVRIGIATAKAFADCKQIPCVGICSLESLAYNVNEEGYICTLINANHDNVYAGFFHISKKDGILQTLESDFTFLDLKDANGNLCASSLLNFLESNANVILPDNSPIYFVGDATELYSDFLQNLPFTKNGSSFATRAIKIAPTTI